MHYLSPVTVSPALVNNPHSILRQQCAPVNFAEWSAAGLRDLIQEMFWLQHHLRGIGLAAPQVGLAQQLIVINLVVATPPGGAARPAAGPALVLINPTIHEPTPETDSGREGCLSIPGYVGMVERARGIRVTAQDAQGQPFELGADGLLARVIQHEVDHLHGILYTDHLRSLADLIPTDAETLANQAVADLYGGSAPGPEAVAARDNMATAATAAVRC